MPKTIMVGCDLHDKKMVVKTAVDRAEPEKRTFENGPGGRKEFIAYLKAKAAAVGGARIVVVYEASSLGFGLHDELQAAGVECKVLAPTRLPRSPRQRKRKNDEADADLLLSVLRGHVLAGNEMPAVEVPSRELRDDRELVRAQGELVLKAARLKTQLRCLLKRHEVRRAGETSRSWGKAYRRWLEGLTQTPEPLGAGARAALGSYLRQLRDVEAEAAKLRPEVTALAQTARHQAGVKRLTKEPGVGEWVALVFLTEVGRASRFENRGQLGAYLGLVPTSPERGAADDRKGHLTHQGPGRIRKALCQAVWARLRSDTAERRFYDRLVARNPKKKKIAVVACMRRLGVRLWHEAVNAERIQPA